MAASSSILPTITTAFVLLLTALPCACPASSSGTNGCGARLLSLAPCMPFAQGTVPDPPNTCCDGLADLNRDRPQCLCLLFNQSLSLPVNRTLTIQLPLLCRLSLNPDTDTCLGLSLPPFGSPRPNASSDNAAAASPVKASPPTPRMNSILFGLNLGGKLRVEGAPVVLVAIAWVLAVVPYLDYESR